jgi:hypothetical protein
MARFELIQSEFIPLSHPSTVARLRRNAKFQQIISVPWHPGTTQGHPLPLINSVTGDMKMGAKPDVR